MLFSSKKLMNHYVISKNLEIYWSRWTKYFVRNRATKEKQVFSLEKANLFEELKPLWTNI
jgi:hypothetical protein